MSRKFIGIGMLAFTLIALFNLPAIVSAQAFDYTGKYSIITQAGLALDVEGNDKKKDSVNIVIFTSKPKDLNQHWRIKLDDADGSYYIQNVLTGRYLEVKGGSKSNSAEIIQYKTSQNRSQRWEIIRESSSSSYYFIKNKNSGLYLDVPGNVKANNNRIIQYASNKGNNQKFKLVPVPEIIKVSSVGKSTFPGDFKLVEAKNKTFTMGDDKGNSAEKPKTVKLVRNYYIGKYPVTVNEYQRVIDGFVPRGTATGTYFNESGIPANGVTWWDAIEYCNTRSRWDGLKPVYTIKQVLVDKVRNRYDRQVTWDKNANGWRLPTEAEWEFACKSGGKEGKTYHYGDSLTTSQANFNGSKPTPVGKYKPNDLGLYDMHGNVYEWCWDWYDHYLDNNSQPRIKSTMNDPTGPTLKPQPDMSFLSDLGFPIAPFRVIRGGSWNEIQQACRSAARRAVSPDYYQDDVSMIATNDVKWNKNGIVGFRIVRNG